MCDRVFLKFADGPLNESPSEKEGKYAMTASEGAENHDPQ